MKEFIQAIMERPFDDAPRLVYADWLEERGDPYGRFIRAQCELVRASATNEAAALYSAFNTQLELIIVYGEEWLRSYSRASGLNIYSFRFVRGFPEHLYLEESEYRCDRCDRWLQLLSMTPISYMRILGAQPQKHVGSRHTLYGWLPSDMHHLSLRGELSQYTLYSCSQTGMFALPNGEEKWYWTRNLAVRAMSDALIQEAKARYEVWKRTQPAAVQQPAPADEVPLEARLRECRGNAGSLRPRR